MYTFRNFLLELVDDDAPLSTDCIEFGFIVPQESKNAKIIKGKLSEEGHDGLAKRLGYKGSQPQYKAISNGLVKYTISSNGSANFVFIPGEYSNKAVRKLILSNKNISNKIFVDATNKKAYCGRGNSYEWSLKEALQKLRFLKYQD